MLNQNWPAFFYFVVFVLFCALILLNLYTGIIFSQFIKINEKVRGRREGEGSGLVSGVDLHRVV